jgi:hypothetical protein
LESGDAAEGGGDAFEGGGESGPMAEHDDVEGGGDSGPVPEHLEDFEGGEDIGGRRVQLHGHHERHRVDQQGASNKDVLVAAGAARSRVPCIRVAFFGRQSEARQAPAGGSLARAEFLLTQVPED